MAADSANVDTITIAALLKALQIAVVSGARSPEALAVLERDTVMAIKGLDASDFNYDEQADGLAEGLRLVRSLFRFIQASSCETVETDG